MFADSNPVKYGLWAEIDNADNSTMAYLSHILPCVKSCNLALVNVQVKKNWSASTESWKIVDTALLQLSLSQGTISKVCVDVDPAADVPSWETFPHACRVDFCEHVLPGCTAKGLIIGCAKGSDEQRCKLHDPQR